MSNVNISNVELVTLISLPLCKQTFGEKSLKAKLRKSPIVTNGTFWCENEALFGKNIIYFCLNELKLFLEKDCLLIMIKEFVKNFELRKAKKKKKSCTKKSIFLRQFFDKKCHDYWCKTRTKGFTLKTQIWNTEWWRLWKLGLLIKKKCIW